MKQFFLLSMAIILLSSPFSFSDVKYESETQLNLEGVAGKMIKFFGAAKPVKTVEYYKDNAKRSDTFDKKGKLSNSQIIDMDKELFISINHDDKSYTQMTFDEWGEAMKSAMQQFSGMETEASAEPETEPEATVDWDLKVNVEETGETETIAGKKCQKVILTLEMDAEVTETNPEEGQAPESAKGGLIVTSTNWLYKGGNKAKKEMDDFNIRLAKKLGMLPGETSMKDMMAQIMESSPQLGEAMEKIKDEGKKLDGLAMRVHTVYESKVDPETAQKMGDEQAEEDEGMEIPTSVGGLLGGFGKKMLKKKMQKDPEVKERNALMQSDTRVLGITTGPLSQDLFTVPAGYKLVKRDDH